MYPTKRLMAIATGAALLFVTLLATPAVAAPNGKDGGSGSGSGSGDSHSGDNGNFSFAVIGDVPYGDAEIQAFPSYIQDINAHKELSFVGHVGDIKNGSSLCTDQYFANIRHNFDTFTLPLVYTPGDNEWTDCHRTNNGAYNPLERLAAVRDVFFPKPGTTLGRPMRVDSQAQQGYPENVNFSKHGIAFTAVNIPGSDNSMLPWTDLGMTTPTAEQVAEVNQRTQADIRELTSTFQQATRNGDRAVVIMTQADMFDPTVANPAQADYAAYTSLVHTLIEQSNAFHGPVYLINGDSHVFNEDHPLAAGSSWLPFYGQSTAVKNLTRVTVDGSSNAQDWLKVSANSKGAAGVLSFERVAFSHPAS
ncbi:MAG: putative transrane protein [Microbacteriaceae bacterium]|nr:putative transrane protein [Microbacteriaceae bacterium]